MLPVSVLGAAAAAATRPGPAKGTFRSRPGYFRSRSSAWRGLALGGCLPGGLLSLAAAEAVPGLGQLLLEQLDGTLLLLLGLGGGVEGPVGLGHCPFGLRDGVTVAFPFRPRPGRRQLDRLRRGPARG